MEHEEQIVELAMGIREEIRTMDADDIRDRAKKIADLTQGGSDAVAETIHNLAWGVRRQAKFTAFDRNKILSGVEAIVMLAGNGGWLATNQKRINTVLKDLDRP